MLPNKLLLDSKSVVNVNDALEMGADLNSKDHKGNTILHNAIAIGNIEMVDELLRLPININEKNIHGYTPLHIACSALITPQKYDIIKLLEKHGADRSIKDNFKRTPYYYMSIKEQPMYEAQLHNLGHLLACCMISSGSSLINNNFSYIPIFACTALTLALNNNNDRMMLQFTISLAGTCSSLCKDDIISYVTYIGLGIAASRFMFKDWQNSNEMHYSH